MSDISDDERAERQSRLLAHGEPASSNGLPLADIDHDEVAVEGGVGRVIETMESKKEKQEPVTWRSLPHRRQLIILTLARLSEPLVQTSLQVSVPFPIEERFFFTRSDC
jgi:hypothetical protein